jgi:hypothetical protein
VSIYNVKNFLGQAPRPPFKTQGRKGGRGSGKQGRGAKERGWDGRVRGMSIPKIKFYDYSTGFHTGKRRRRDVSLMATV